MASPLARVCGHGSPHWTGRPAGRPGPVRLGESQATTAHPLLIWAAEPLAVSKAEGCLVARDRPGLGGLAGGRGGGTRGSEPGAAAWAGAAGHRGGEGEASVSSRRAEGGEASSSWRRRGGRRLLPGGAPHLSGGAAWHCEISFPHSSHPGVNELCCCSRGTVVGAPPVPRLSRAEAARVKADGMGSAPRKSCVSPTPHCSPLSAVATERREGSRGIEGTHRAFPSGRLRGGGREPPRSSAVPRGAEGTAACLV